MKHMIQEVMADMAEGMPAVVIALAALAVLLVMVKIV